MKQLVLDEHLPGLTAQQLFEILFQDPTFVLSYHEKKGDTEVQVGPWTLAPEGRKQRIVRYCPPAPTNPVIRKLAGNSTHVKEIQLYHFTPSGDLVVTSTLLFDSSSLVDFDCKIEWHCSEGHCRITAQNEYKRRLFKEMIEGYLAESAAAHIHLWLELARRQLHHLGLYGQLKEHGSTSIESYVSSTDDIDEAYDAYEQTDSVMPSPPATSLLPPHKIEEETEALWVDASEDLLELAPKSQMGGAAGEACSSIDAHVAVLTTALRALQRQVSQLSRMVDHAHARLLNVEQSQSHQQQSHNQFHHQFQEGFRDVVSRINALEASLQTLPPPLPSVSSESSVSHREQARRGMRSRLSAQSSTSSSSASLASPPGSRQRWWRVTAVVGVAAALMLLVFAGPAVKGDRRGGSIMAAVGQVVLLPLRQLYSLLVKTKSE